jgi:RsiW-degrading membrane proteinase PrsW (M82 family)
MNLSAAIATGSGYFALALVPPLIWLIVYLREDEHREPFYLIILTFLGGIASAIAALVFQNLVLAEFDPIRQFIFVFAVIAISEEFFKFMAVKLLVSKRPEFNEPVDAMIYMITAGLGFAAIENMLFLVFQSHASTLVFSENLINGTELSALRFIGANQLHALASGVVGFSIARAWFPPYRKFSILWGLVFASILHAGFNYLIILKDALPGSILYLSALLLTALAVVLIDFHKLKRRLVTPA